MTTITDPEKIKYYFGPTSPYWFSRPVFGEVKKHGSDYHFEISEAKIGKYAIVLEDVSEYCEDGEIKKEADLYRLRGTQLNYYFDEEDGKYKISAFNKGLYNWRADFVAGGIRVELAEPREEPDRVCRSCGSEEFDMQMSATLRVKAENKNEFSWDGNVVSLKNSLTALKCSSCGVDHPNRASIRFRDTQVNDVDITDGVSVVGTNMNLQKVDEKEST